MQQFTPYEYLLIALANAYGKDKCDYNTRLLWAHQNMDRLEDMTPSDLNDHPMYMAAVVAVRDTQRRLPTGYMVGLDAGASGIQILSTCSRCAVGMANTGVIDDGQGRPDIYTKLTNLMGSGVKRKPAKSALMCFMYGSEAEPEKAFGNGSVLDVFHRTAEALAPRAYKLRTLLVGSWQPNALSHDWVMPDRHHVHKRVWQTKDTKITVPMLNNRSFTFRHTVNQGTEAGLGLAAHVTHSIDGFVVREMHARCNYSKKFLESRRKLLIDNTTGAITDRCEYASIGLLDVVTDEELVGFNNNFKLQLLDGIEYVLAQRSFELCTIHDEFKCLANNVHCMRKHYNRILWELYHSNLLFNIVEQITGKKYAMPAFEQTVADSILENNYAIN